ncbi:hypothetical protein [Bradyrhizobium sp. B120]|uniref:hypothetical protein n=1 Tax=Bradyrhizobium sp. B120 TaxID=3410088 RepID=UPI003B985A00
MKLNLDGSLVELPVQGGAAQTGDDKAYYLNALKALVDCQPYRLPSEYYDEWKDFEPAFEEHKAVPDWPKSADAVTVGADAVRAQTAPSSNAESAGVVGKAKPSVPLADALGSAASPTKTRVFTMPVLPDGQLIAEATSRSIRDAKAIGSPAPPASATSLAEPLQSQCSGILHQLKGDLLFGAGRGEGEGICVVSKAEIGKVLKKCSVGGRCVVDGSVDICKDSGECVEIKNIVAVRKSVERSMSSAYPGDKIMPIDFVGEWCSPTTDGNTTNYTLPSWTQDRKCTGILSISKLDFTFNMGGEKEVYCDPEAIRTRQHTAPSGTAYFVVISANCYLGSAPNRKNWRSFEFSRYKGNLTVTEKEQSGMP